MLSIHRFMVSQRAGVDPRAIRLLADAKALGFSDITGFAYQDIYFIEGDLNAEQQQTLAARLLSDPVAQHCDYDAHHSHINQTIETALRPGVTDPVAEQIVRGAQLLGMTVTRAATGQRFVVQSERPLSQAELNKLALRLLVNPVIHHYALGTVEAVFPQASISSGQVVSIPVRELSNEQLRALSHERRAALDLQEMQAVQAYFCAAGRDPTDVEFETIAQTWSEHCSHKTFKADITYNNQSINGLLKTYIKAATDAIAAPWVWSAFVDNAGIIEFDEEHQVAFKVETHNHPSAIEPFGGANTGLGGVIRDVLGVSARPIAATDIFCFGQQDIALADLPEGTLHPRLIQSGVVSGVQDYGNKTGIPTVNGAIWYDSGYTANPLVFCGCVGLLPKNKHPREPQPGDHVIILGGRTGRDGLRGATFSSMTMDAQTGEVAGASVQIGDPIIAKGLIEVITRARDNNLYHAITDCGAGGLSSAVGEMASSIGADVDLMHVRLKYPGLTPWEIWLSEAQERMALAVPAKNIAALQALCDVYDIELTDLGQFTNTQQLVVRYEQSIVLQLANDFLYDRMPQKKLMAHTPTISVRPKKTTSPIQHNDMLLKLLAHPNIASKEAVIRLYDHEIQAGTVIKPLIGIKNDGPSDACVLKPLGTKGKRGIVLANGLNPELGKYDCYAMAVSVIDEAVRNAVAVGANPQRIAILDNFCWGDPNRPETLGALVAAAHGCYDAALHYQTPFISGKDSLNNEYYSADGQRHAIPATLLISALGMIDDVNLAVSMDFKKAGNVIYLLGETKAELVGSHFSLSGGEVNADQTIPSLPEYAPALYSNLHQAMQKKLVRACHDLSEGGLAVAVAEMCIGGRLGCKLQLDGEQEAAVALFSESNGRLLVEIAPENCAAFEAYFNTQPELIKKLGQVTDATTLIIAQHNKNNIEIAVNDLVNAWQRN